jgi:hypothetical protein
MVENSGFQIDKAFSLFFQKKVQGFLEQRITQACIFLSLSRKLGRNRAACCLSTLEDFFSRPYLIK